MAPQRGYTRSPEKAEEAILDAILRLQEKHGNEFKITLPTLMDNIDRRRIPPSSPAAKEALVNLPKTTRGAIQVKENGRGYEVKVVGKVTRGGKRGQRPRLDAPILTARDLGMEDDGEGHEESDAASLQGLQQALQKRTQLRDRIHGVMDKIMKENEELENLLSDLESEKV